MKEVQIQKDFHGRWMPSWAGEVDELFNGEGCVPSLWMSVRYDNGQLCTFRRKVAEPNAD